MKAIERLFEYFNFKGIKPTRFEKDTGLSNGYLLVQKKRNADIGTRILSVIINNCLDLSIEWLITGNGQMIKNERIEDNIELAKLEAKLEAKGEEIDRLMRIIEMMTNEATGHVDADVQNKKAG